MMKSLSESLFDQNIVSKKLPIEKYIEDFSSDTLAELFPAERNELFDTLFEIGDKCNANDLRKNPIDLTENIIIARRDKLVGLTEASYPCKYNFIYQLSASNSLPKFYQRTLISTLQDYRDGKSYYWETNSLDNVDKKPTWKGKVAAFYTPYCSYSVISNKKWVENIIEGILLD